MGYDRPIHAVGLGDIPTARMKLSGARVQLNGEVFRDKGCEVSPSCLSCPLPRCQFEVSAEEREALLRVAGR